MRFKNLATLTLQNVGAVSVQNARRALEQRSRVFAGFQSLARSLDANQAHCFVFDIGIKNAHRIAAAPDTGNHRIGLLARILRRHLLQAFLTDHTLEITHHHRIRMRTSHRANDVERVVHVRHPVAHGLVERVLECSAAGFDWHHFRAQQVHAVYVGRLALHVFRPHVHHAFQSVAGANRCRGHAMLAGTRFSNDARLAHAAGQQRLANGVVDLVRPGVVQVFTLEVDLRTAHFPAHAGSMVDRRWTTHEMRQFVFELGNEIGIMLVAGIGLFELVDGVGKRFGNERSAILAKMSLVIGLLVGVHTEFLSVRKQDAKTQRLNGRRKSETCSDCLLSNL